MLFVLTNTVYSESDAKDLWAVLTDVNGWPSWEPKLKVVHPDGHAKAGGTYVLHPEGANAVTVQILKASDGVFHDLAKLEFGTVETERTIVAHKTGGSIVTQTIRANIQPDAARTFQRVFWPQWSQGVFDSTKALAREPERKAHLARHRNVA